MLRIPTLHGLIRRRILVNFRADADRIQPHLPAGLRPKVYNGYAVVGICLIRLEQIRSQGFPAVVGVQSENAAHRIAVEWDQPSGTVGDGVFIPRRDSSSHLNHLLGGRVVSGEHHRATFAVTDDHHTISLVMHSQDATVEVRFAGRTTSTFPTQSIFPSLHAASAFFETGALGYSVTHDPHRLDGLILATQHWHVEPLDVQDVYASYFTNTHQFPAGTVTFDHALVMRNIPHQWRNAPSMYI